MRPLKVHLKRALDIKVVDTVFTTESPKDDSEGS